MGADIHGWVEVKTGYGWDGIVKIDHLVHRSYGMFGSLFGHRNYDDFRPTAKGRGVPDDPSVEVASEELDESGAVGTTWILWSEIAAIDWEEEGAAGESFDLSDPYYPPTPPPRRRDYLTGGWVTLFKIMEVLAADYGPDGVRLFVWFDME